MKRRLIAVLLLSLLILPAVPASAEDWPMWRYDAGRTAASPTALPKKMHLHWVRHYAAREQVWDDPLNQDLMHYDAFFEPVIMGGLLFIGFNDTDKVVALDLATGEERWRFYADGPVRLPCAAFDGAVYFTSDDGGLYCLDAEAGTLRWHLDGAPRDRKVIGNKRLISTWPARGGVVIQDSTAYFANSIWPFMGTFIYAVDAKTGRVKWLNDSNGSEWLKQPHNAMSFAGVAPQGALAIAGDHLLVPGGRSVPACFDKRTGAFRYYLHGDSGKSGGAFVAARDGVYFNHYREEVVSMFAVASGESLASGIGRYPVLADGTYYFSGKDIDAVDAEELPENPKKWRNARKWSFEADATGDLILAGPRLYAAGAEGITAVNVTGTKPRPAWEIGVPGTVKRLVAGGGMLVAVTLEGDLLAFGAEDKPATDVDLRVAAPTPDAVAAQPARLLLDKGGVHDGVALVYGPTNSTDLAALADTSELDIVAVTPNAGTVEALRGELDAQGRYGKRISVFAGTPADFNAPPYAAAVTLLLDLASLTEQSLPRLYESMRPYGGVLVARGAASRLAMAQASGLHGLSARADGADLILVREGALEGAAPWTHLLGDIAQTGKSDDARVKLPLGLLWFGGSSNLDVLPRHGHGPPEQVIGGRLFIEGMDMLSARDVYTGRVLWRKKLPELGTFGIYFDESYKDTPTSTQYNQRHIAGANARNTNYVATADIVYVALGAKAAALDAATGETLKEFPVPGSDAANAADSTWGYIGVQGDFLLGSAGFISYSALLKGTEDLDATWDDFDHSASKRLFALNRHSGEVAWELNAAHGFLHNAIVVGADTVFCLDKLPVGVEKHLARRGKAPQDGYRLRALDLASGEARWEDSENVFGTFLAYAKEQGLLVQSTRPSRDTLSGENGRRMNVFRAKDGKLVWNHMMGYATFPILHGGHIVTESGLFGLETGDDLDRANPFTGEAIPWRWKRQHGCNHPIASEHLITFRSGAAGFCAFSGSGGTGNFGGFKSSCTSNLVVADGVLNAPDYTRTCTCAYQNQTSLAMAHDPLAEYWTYHELDFGEARIQRMGVNLGAPGDRETQDGLVWLEYPIQGGPSPELEVDAAPEDATWFRHHSARYEGDGPRWVAASGVEGATNLRLRLAPEDSPARSYSVRLCFAEPDDLETGERVFDVLLQGQPVLTGFDMANEAGGVRSVLLKSFENVAVETKLHVELVPKQGRPPILCGIEVIMEEK